MSERCFANISNVSDLTLDRLEKPETAIEKFTTNLDYFLLVTGHFGRISDENRLHGLAYY